MVGRCGAASEPQDFIGQPASLLVAERGSASVRSSVFVSDTYPTPRTASAATLSGHARAVRSVFTPGCGPQHRTRMVGARDPRTLVETARADERPASSPPVLESPRSSRAFQCDPTVVCNVLARRYYGNIRKADLRTCP